MGKYNFDYARLEKIENLMQNMQNEIARLTAENEKLRQSHKEPYAREIVNKLNQTNYLYLFGIESDKSGSDIHSTQNKQQAYKVFTPFWENFKRALFPIGYEKQKMKDGRARIIGKALDDLTEDEYKITCETLSAVIDTLAYGKRQIEKVNALEVIS